MPYQHKSGAQKRRERKVRHKKEKEVIGCCWTLFEFGIQQGRPTTSAGLGNSGSDEDFDHEASTIRGQEQDYQNDSTPMPETCRVKVVSESDETHSTCHKTENCGVDVGLCPSEIPTQEYVEDIIRKGPLPHPKVFPVDSTGRKFPLSVLSVILPNGQSQARRWLVFSPKNQSLYCLPCRLFSHKAILRQQPNMSILASSHGWGTEQKWKKLCEKLPIHEKSAAHKNCTVTWRELESRLRSDAGIDLMTRREIMSEAEKWRNILTRIIDVIIFLGERGLAYRGSSQRIGDNHNGNFLGIIELVARYDPVLAEHVANVKASQERGERLQVHYLSSSSQIEFISNCADYVRNHILDGIRDAKYYSIMVDATPDSSHIEQTTFIICFFDNSDSGFAVRERFLAFVDCCKKTGKDIASLIIETLEYYGIPLKDCRGQGYDNAANMSGKYNGAQQHILAVNPLCIYSPCACHSLNLCGADSAACCTEAVTFFGVVQTVYNLFSSSPQRWAILKEFVDGSIHGLSGTRWTDRVASVKPFAANLPGIRLALKKLLTLNLSPKTVNEVNGAVSYVSSFICVFMSSIWVKILVHIDMRNQIIQAREATIDVQVSNLESLLEDLKELREKWPQILNESKLVAVESQIEPHLPSQRRLCKRPRPIEDDENTVKRTLAIALNLNSRGRYSMP